MSGGGGGDGAAHGWRHYFGTLVASYASVKHRKQAVRADGSVRAPVRVPIASHATREITDSTTMRLVQILRDELGFKVLKPENLDGRHMEAWARYINEHRQTDRLPATLARYATCIRKLVVAAGRPELVEVFERHLDPNSTARRLVTDQDKTFEGNGVDVEQVIVNAWGEEPWVSMVMLFQDTFGARRREGCMCQPLADFDLATGVVHIRRGKGGRKRDVPIRTDQQMRVALQLQQFVRWRNLACGRMVNAASALAPVHLGEQQALQRYSDVAKAVGLTKRELGVVGHGLRTGYLCQLLEDMGIKAVVKGGTGRHTDPVQTKIRLLIASEHMGHSRANIVGAYAGSPYVAARVLASEYLRERGMLLPGRDARSIDVNAQRITHYLDSVREELARQDGPAGSQMPPQPAGCASPDAENRALGPESTSREFQTVQTHGIWTRVGSAPLVSSNEPPHQAPDQPEEQ